MANELEFKIRLDEVDFNNILWSMHDSMFTIKDIYQKDTIYTLPKDNNNENLLRIRKEDPDTVLTYKHLCFTKDTFIGCDEYETRDRLSIEANEVFSEVNKTFGLKADTNFKIKINELETYIEKVYKPFIIDKTILEKIRHEIVIFEANGKKITIALDKVTNLGYFLEIEYLSKENLSDNEKLEIRQFLEKLLHTLFNLQKIDIVKKGYLSMLKE